MNTPSLQKLEDQLNLRISQINLLVSIFRGNADLIQNKYCSTSSFDFRIFSWDSSEEIEATSADLSAAYSKLNKAYGRFHDNYNSILINLEALCMRAKIERFNSSISEEKREMNRVCYNFESAEQITVAINKLSSYVDSFLTKAQCFLAFCKQAANFSKLRKQVYITMREHGEITCKQLSAKLKIDEDTLENILTDLMAAGLIDCSGVQKLHVHLDNPACITSIDQPFKYKINLAAPPDNIKILFS